MKYLKLKSGIDLKDLNFYGYTPEELQGIITDMNIFLKEGYVEVIEDERN